MSAANESRAGANEKAFFAYLDGFFDRARADAFFKLFPVVIPWPHAGPPLLEIRGKDMTTLGSSRTKKEH